jgi:hypothetical protein
MLRRYADAESYLEKIVDATQAHTTNDALIYAEYNNLFIQRLKTNLNKVKIVIGLIVGHSYGKSSFE